MRHFNYLLDEDRFYKVSRRLNYLADRQLKLILEDFNNNLYSMINIEVYDKKVTLIRPVRKVGL